MPIGSQVAQAHDASSLPPTSIIKKRPSLIKRNVTLAMQHMEVLCYNGLNFESLCGEKR